MGKPFSSQISRVVSKINLAPGPLKSIGLTKTFGTIVKFVGTAGVKVESLDFDRAVMSIANKKKVQNHIGGVHAAAMGLLAETATGFVVGINVPDDRVNVIKTLKVDYLKRAKGNLRAVATLTPEQIESIRTTEKGEVSVAIEVTDEEGKQPIAVEASWAWIPKKRK